MRLTELTVRSLKSPEKGQKTYLDDTLRGFGVRVSPQGAKAFVLVHGRNRSRMTIGRYPVISLSEARIRAKEILAEQTLGRSRLPTTLFSDAVELYLAGLHPRNKPSSVQSTRRRLIRHFLPPLRRERLEDITASQISKIIDRLLDTPSEANHALVAVRGFFTWTERRHLVTRNPCALLQAPTRAVSRDRVLSDEELGKVLSAATLEESMFGSIVALLVLTGQRRGEIVALSGKMIDMQGKTITLPASLTKNGREHRFPFGRRTEELLRRQFQDGILFPARGSNGFFSGWSKCKARFDRKCGVQNWTLHDLRRTFATQLAALGAPIHVTEKLLNHVTGTISGVAAIYNRHSYMDEMRQAVAAYDAHLASLASALSQHLRIDATVPFQKVSGDST